MHEFTGKETAADVVRMFIDDFSKSSLALELRAALEITYQGDIPLLRYQAQVKNNLGEFVCQYRLDKMLLTVYPECERIYNEADQYGILGEDDDPRRREKTVHHLAYYAMNMMLSRLFMHQVALFEENFDDAVFLTASTFLTALAQAYRSVDAEKSAKAANDGVRPMLDSRVEASAKKKRELLVGLLNRFPSLSIPTGRGRPQGSTKPVEKKAQEAAEFEKKVEAAIRSLLSPTGEMPTKTAVAKALGIGGLSLKGVDSSLNAFSNKLRNLKIAYNAIVERVRLNK